MKFAAKTKTEYNRSMAKYGNIKGVRVIGGREENYDSKGEANLARVLELQKQQGIIKDWERGHVFDLNLAGNVTKYRKNVIDYRVVHNDGTEAFYEYKGLLDTQSFMRLKITAKYYGDLGIILVLSKMPKPNTPAYRRVEKLKAMGVVIRDAREMFRGYKEIITGWE